MSFACSTRSTENKVFRPHAITQMIITDWKELISICVMNFTMKALLLKNQHNLDFILQNFLSLHKFVLHPKCITLCTRIKKSQNLQMKRQNPKTTNSEKIYIQEKPR